METATMTEMMTSLGETSAAEAVRLRHREFYLLLAEQSEAACRTSDQRAWFELLGRSFDNIAAAFEWSLERGDIDEALRMLGPLYRFADDRSPFDARIREMLERALATRGGGPAARAKALMTLGALRAAPTLRFTSEQLRATFDEAVAEARAAGDRRLEAAALAVLGGARTDFRWHPRDPEVLDRALAMAREVDDGVIVADIVLAQASAAKASGDAKDVVSRFDDAVSRYREMGDVWNVGWALCELAWFLQGHGLHTPARERLEDMWRIADELDDPLMLACAAQSLSGYFHDSGDYEDGRDRFERALATARGTDTADLHQWMLCELGAFHERFDRLEEAKASFEEALVLSPSWDNGGAHAGLARVAARDGDADGAAAHADAAVRMARAKSYWSAADGLLPAAIIAMSQGRFDDARTFLDEALEFKDAHMPAWIWQHALVWAQLDRLRGELDSAAERFGELISSAAASWLAVDASRLLGRVEIDRGDHSAAALALTAALEGAIRHQSNWLIVMTAHEVGRLAAAVGAEAKANRLLGHAEQLRRDFGWTTPFLISREYEASVSRLPAHAPSVASVDDVIDLAHEALSAFGVRP